VKVVLKNVIFWSQNSRGNAAKTSSHFFKMVVLAYFKGFNEPLNKASHTYLLTSIFSVCLDLFRRPLEIEGKKK